MSPPSPAPRLTDIDAVELIRSEMTGVTLEAFSRPRPCFNLVLGVPQAAANTCPPRILLAAFGHKI
jgi:hypothetical protein